MSVIIYSFNLNILPEMSYGVLQCDIVMLQNDMLMILKLKRGIICAGPCILFFGSCKNKLHKRL